MTRKYVLHAQHVVDAFKGKLSDSGRQHVGDRHFDELALLIESAVSTAVLEAMEHTADNLVELADKLRKEVEHI